MVYMLLMGIAESTRTPCSITWRTEINRATAVGARISMPLSSISQEFRTRVKTSHLASFARPKAVIPVNLYDSILLRTAIVWRHEKMCFQFLEPWKSESYFHFT